MSRSRLTRVWTTACVFVCLLGARGARAEWGDTETYSLELFSDVGAQYVASSDAPAAFVAGSVDFFATARLSESTLVLAESVLEILEDGPVFDLERIYYQWQPASFAAVRVGRIHLPLGYYQPTFHHALFVQRATARPVVLNFEDEGGFLPAHATGVEVLGRVPLGDSVKLGYSAGIGNGRGQFADDVLSTFDRNHAKAYWLQLALLPRIGSDANVGLTYYNDAIPKGFADDAGTVLVPEGIGEQLFAAHLLFEMFDVHFLGELFFVRHETRRTNRITELWGGFVQVAYDFETWGPYARFDHLDRDDDDDFFNASGSPVRAQELRAGVGFVLTGLSVLKVEYVGDLENDEHGAAAQIAFAMGGGQ